jgi:hypothetical protein
MVKTIPLTRGLSTIVDDQDWETVKNRKWFAACTGRVYAATGQKQGLGLLFLHRLLLNAPQGKHVIHVDGNGLNNTRGNLCLYRNSGCRRKIRIYGDKETSSKFLGVCETISYGKREINANIVFDGRKEFLGTFQTQEAAAKYYDHAARVLLRRPRLNFPDFFDERLLERVKQRLAARGIATRKPMETQT